MAVGLRVEKKSATNHRLLGKEPSLYSSYAFSHSLDKYLLSACHVPCIVLGARHAAGNNQIKSRALIELMIMGISEYSVPGAVPCSVM